MISIIESSFLHPPTSIDPSDDDLNKYGLTREQYNSWKKNNPDSRWRKFDNWYYNPKTLMVMSAMAAMNGNYVSAANKLNYTLPEEVEKRNLYRLHVDLDAARKYYNKDKKIV